MRSGRYAAALAVRCPPVRALGAPGHRGGVRRWPRITFGPPGKERRFDVGLAVAVNSRAAP